jgi:predicted ester cyclase
MGIPATNRKISWSEIHIYRLENGKIAEHWVELSMFELLTQIQAK